MVVAINGGGFDWIRALTGLQGRRHKLLVTNHSAADLAEIVALLGATGARPHIDGGRPRPFTPEAVEQGFERLESRRAQGKIVFEVGAEGATEGAAVAAVGSGRTTHRV